MFAIAMMDSNCREVNVVDWIINCCVVGFCVVDSKQISIAVRLVLVTLSSFPLCG